MTETNETTSNSPVTRRLHIRRFIRLLTWTLVIFICGGAAGWGLSILCRRPPTMGMGFGPELSVNEMVYRLQQELLLSDDQAKQVRQIYQAREDALRSIHQKMEPAMKAEYDQLDQQMKQVLNSAQYQRWSERFQTLRNRILPPPPPGERGPDQWSGPGQHEPGGPGMGGHGMGGPDMGGPPRGPGGPDGLGPEQGDRPNHGPPGSPPPP